MMLGWMNKAGPKINIIIGAITIQLLIRQYILIFQELNDMLIAEDKNQQI